MIKRFCFWLLVICCVCGDGKSLFAQAVQSFHGLPFITHYDASDYNAGIQNWDILQDELGRMLVANNLGLLEFDGKVWARYGLNNTKVRSASLGKNGRIYVGSQADFGYLESNRAGQLEYVSLADSLTSELRDFDETWKVYEIDGVIYFCTFKRVFRFENERLTAIGSDRRLDISFKVNNQILTQIPGLGLHLLQNENFELIRNGEFFADKRVSNVLPFDQNQWLISTFNHGLFIYDGEIKPFSLSPVFWKNEFLINHCVRLKNGNIALGTQNAGVFLLDSTGELILHLNKTSGLSDLTINYIFEDGVGALWLAMNNGISRIDLNSPFTIIDDKMGLTGSGYAALKVGNSVYLGTNNGLFILQDQKLRFVPGTEGQVYSIQLIQGKVILGHHNGTFLVDGNQAQRISSEQGAWLLKAHPQMPGYYIQGTYTGLSLFEWRDGRPVFLRELEGFGESSRVMEFEGNSLWIAHGYKGVFKVSFDQNFTRVTESKLYNSAQGFPNDVLINVYKISNRLIFTANGGFYGYDPQEDRFSPLNEYNDLFRYGTVIADLEPDNLGNIYFIEQSQLGLIKKGINNQMSLHTAPFQKVRKLWNDDLANIIALDQQNILIGGKKGFIHYNPSLDFPNPAPPKVFFREILNSGRRVDSVFLGHSLQQASVGENIFPYAQNSLSFDFATAHFESGNEVQYQFFLENYDQEWSNWTAESKKEYTNLREGDYLFRVKAKTLFGQETEELTYAFTVRPPFYRSILAYLIYSIAIGAFLFSGFKWLDKRYKKQTELLELEKEQAIQQKDEEIESITQRSEEEIMRLKNEQLQSEIEFKSQELTSSAMHLIQKNKLLQDVKNSLINLSSDENNKSLQTQLNRLVKSIDKDLEGGDEWSRFAENFDQVHGNFITRLKEKFPDLTPQEIKFSAYIRMNLNTKEIANLLGISVRGVEIGRYRVRKKLGLSRQDSLSDFLLRF
ncbi:triple tyrosine motif-containing protein [Algoriphagus sp. AK58]|uniref:ligand-binding sensor domain-containing protein n=1 Tax=Algoriphagus sp. AK58 TaxID=1406877 RepID=UPI0016503E7E|nr:triple tyrosine motif-containing protein [Algoriphagus sp. AK58]MBC6367061.1 two component regulator three y domain-containing protein [Algoriphagus sp. AK58]